MNVSLSTKRHDVFEGREEGETLTCCRKVPSVTNDFWGMKNTVFGLNGRNLCTSPKKWLKGVRNILTFGCAKLILRIIKKTISRPFVSRTQHCRLMYPRRSRGGSFGDQKKLSYQTSFKTVGVTWIIKRAKQCKALQPFQQVNRAYRFVVTKMTKTTQFMACSPQVSHAKKCRCE